MVTEHGSDWYRSIVAVLDPCTCHVCRRGTAVTVEKATGEPSRCPVCEGAGEISTEDGVRTCSSCLGGG